MKICKIKNCKNKTGKRNNTCSTHQYRKRKFGSYRFDLPINYKRHGFSQTSEYKSWSMMKNRCNNEQSFDFKYYGGRGIRLDKKWLNFLTFLKDMGRKPTPAHTIERINNSLGYTKLNCRWATRREQALNTRSNKLNRQAVSEIKKLYAKGVFQKAIARRFRVGVGAVGKAIRGETWR